MAAQGNNSNLCDDFEAAFQSCFSTLINQDSTCESDEIKTSVEQSIQKFLDSAKQLESHFLQQRLVLSMKKPEQIVKEDISDIRSELSRKDALLQKHYEKLAAWQTKLRNIQGSQPPQQSVQLPPQAQPGPTSMPNPQQSPNITHQVMSPHGQQLHHQPHPMHPPHTPPTSQGVQFSQGPLAYLERTTSNIGLPESR
ncbi:mediator of RNA polymerase II transcription subunit 28-like [Lineus longissimus]|uniref:mediator of RNA polymerase II transcription subunit 28-like n=1 Tax=Lineus longissimus TaxID=88925 RepID=UPI002B4EE8D9